jgi:hypothetical protein
MTYYVMIVNSGEFVTDRNAWNRGSFIDRRGYKSEAAAKACRTRMLKLDNSPFDDNELAVINSATHKPRKVARTNLMSGQTYMEDVNTPMCCSPSSETYWSL